ncbi:CRAL-TRIO domain-containing protein [Pisolithus croceorrhizus]|nr:CRAL-TRIO domain-containing protein [Pisolithus croceorrhizus]
MTSSIPLTRQQEDILEQFRRQVFQEDILREGDSIGTDDLALLRFLRARKFDLNEAKKMIKDAQHWRRTVAGVGVDELYNRLDIFDVSIQRVLLGHPTSGAQCPPLSSTLVASRSSGLGRCIFTRHVSHTTAALGLLTHPRQTDKMGRPLNIEFLGGCDLPELYKHITPDKHWETIVTTTETLVRKIIPAASRAAGHDIGGVFVIIDLKGFGLSQFWQVKSLAQASLQISQDYYPERMAKLAIVNAPSSFTFIWSIVKPWLAKETAEKVDVLGSDYQGVLLELIDAESLPATLGGKCTCEHAGGCDLSGAGPWMDERLARSTQAANHTFTVDTRADPSLSSPSEPAPEHDGNRGTSARLVGDVADGSSNVNSGANTSSDDTAV